MSFTQISGWLGRYSLRRQLRIQHWRHASGTRSKLSRYDPAGRMEIRSGLFAWYLQSTPINPFCGHRVRQNVLVHRRSDHRTPRPEMDAVILFGAIGLLLFCYFWLRMGPKRCPNCRTFVWGVWGVPVGIRRMQFRCKSCGTKFQGHSRFPL